MNNEQLQRVESIAISIAAVGVLIFAVYAYIIEQREMVKDAAKIAQAVKVTSPEAAIYNGS